MKNSTIQVICGPGKGKTASALGRGISALIHGKNVIMVQFLKGSMDSDNMEVLKRAKYFITCSGKMMYRIPIEEDFITRQLIGEDGKQNWEIDHPQTYRQLSLFDDFNFQSEVTVEDSSKTLFGQM